MTEKVFTGPLDRQLRDALSYIQNYIIKEKVTKVPGRAEAERIYNYPYAAVEEALSNAVYHNHIRLANQSRCRSRRTEWRSPVYPDRTERFQQKILPTAKWYLGGIAIAVSETS